MQLLARISIFILMLCFSGATASAKCDYGDKSDNLWKAMKGINSSFENYRWEVFPIRSAWGLGTILRDLPKKKDGKRLSQVRCDRLLSSIKIIVQNGPTLYGIENKTASDANIYDKMTDWVDTMSEGIQLDKNSREKMSQILFQGSVSKIVDFFKKKGPAISSATQSPSPSSSPSATSTPSGSETPTPTPSASPTPAASPTSPTTESETGNKSCNQNKQGTADQNSVYLSSYKCSKLTLTNATVQQLQLDKVKFITYVNSLKKKKTNNQELTLAEAEIVDLEKGGNLYVVTDVILISDMKLDFSSNRAFQAGIESNDVGVNVESKGGGDYSITAKKPMMFARQGCNYSDRECWPSH